MGEDEDIPDITGNKSASFMPARKRARILYEITILLIIIMLVYGLATFFLIRNSQERLIDKSIEHLVEVEAENYRSTFDYAIQIMIPAYLERFEQMDLQELSSAMAQKRIIDMQDAVNADMQAMIDAGFGELSEIMIVLPPSQYVPEAMVWASTDEGLIYQWEVPEYLIEAMEEGTQYILMEDGVPELGLEGEYIITIEEIPDPLSFGMSFSYLGFISIQEETAAIREFYNQESRRASVYLAAILIGSIIIVILIIFFFLNHLIKKQITEPMDELSAAAERVMQGNLDVQVGIEDGEELESLKRAFNEMVESFRKYVPRSPGQE